MKKLALIVLMALKRKVMITSQQKFKSYINLTNGVIKSSMEKWFMLQINGRRDGMLMVFVII